MAQSSSKSPELLARYCDSLLKKRWVRRRQTPLPPLRRFIPTERDNKVLQSLYLTSDSQATTLWVSKGRGTVRKTEPSNFCSDVFIDASSFCSSKNPEEAELEDTLNQVVRRFHLVHTQPLLCSCFRSGTIA